MLDIAVLAASAVSLLTPFLKKPAEKEVEKLGDRPPARFLEKDPEWAKLLQELLSNAGTSTQTQVTNVTGDNNKVAQVQGPGDVIA